MPVDSVVLGKPSALSERSIPRCAEICRALSEPLAGTAPAAARGWLLVEHPGPWPAFGLPADLPVAVTHFAERALQYGVRTQLIRRPDRSERRPKRLRVLIAGGVPQARWIEERADTCDERADTLGAALEALDPTRFVDGPSPRFGTPAAPTLLVCTHGRREVCCAAYGRPVARALAERFGDAVWETTHVGGDRFAASLVALPSGAYFGRLDPASALRVAEAALEGRIEPDRFRGTAGLSPSAQAAECFLRRALGQTRADAVIHLGADRRDGVRLERFSAAGLGTRTVTLREREARQPRLTSCGQGTVDCPTVYELVDITANVTADITSGG
ncbi:sucrase ferredoxin [Actinocrinis sp.]|uniref:sucrase ferredoxin n=1 Tax=Actinocrinis sp. TaxID=1920516 RepID=UPI002DDD7CCF|nr:sucrase ferredoxin [Actinocrinis sp.]